MFTLSVSQSCHRSQTLNLSSPPLLSASLERKIVAAPLRHSTKFTSSSSRPELPSWAHQSPFVITARSSDGFSLRSPSPSVLMRPDRQRLIFSPFRAKPIYFWFTRSWLNWDVQFDLIWFDINSFGAISFAVPILLGYERDSESWHCKLCKELFDMLH